MKQSIGSDDIKPEQSRTELLKGAAVLACAQFSAASTASCVKALPIVTPSVLRGLWRQTLTSIIFSTFTFIMWIRSRNHKEESKVDAKSDEEMDLLPKARSKQDDQEKINNDNENVVSASRIVLVALTVIGATLLNDTIVVALRFASSAAVMCLCNTTPIWLILYAIINCKAETPGAVTIMGALLSLFGTIICSTGEGDDGVNHENEKLGAIIATIGAIGGAIYMTACRKLAPCGIHPIHLSLIINIGMMCTTLLLCVTTLPNGIVFFSTDVSCGFFGFLNPVANPAALLHSIFPDLGGNFGIMLALQYFDPLIVSMVMLTEPLNASVIAMYAVGEAPPSIRTIKGVAIVLVGCATVLWESSKDAKGSSQLLKRTETEETLDTMESQTVEGYGTMGTRSRESLISSNDSASEYATIGNKRKSSTDASVDSVDTGETSDCTMEIEEGCGPSHDCANEHATEDQREMSNAVLYSQLGKIVPKAAAKASRMCEEYEIVYDMLLRRHSMPDEYTRGCKEMRRSYSTSAFLS